MLLREIDNVQLVDDYSTCSCPECGSDSFIVVGTGYRCLSCGITAKLNQISRCSYCETLFWKNAKDLGMCPVCREYHMRKLEKE